MTSNTNWKRLSIIIGVLVIIAIMIRLFPDKEDKNTTAVTGIAESTSSAGRLNGMIVDGRTGDGLKDATVIVEHSQGDSTSASTGERGHYLLALPKKGTYSIIAEKDGYIMDTGKATVSIEKTGSNVEAPVISMSYVQREPVVETEEDVRESEKGLESRCSLRRQADK